MKQKKCKQCKELFEPKRPLQYLCSPKCATDYATENYKKKEQKATQKWIKETKEKLRTHKDYLQVLQILINKIVRLIDKDCPCIATGNVSGKMNAGHFTSVGSNPTIRFHLDNIHIQSEHSNTHKHGDTLNYIDGLRNIYGEDYLNFVYNLRSIKSVKLNAIEIKDKILIAKNIIKDLEKNNSIYNAKERLLLRKKYNNKLGIYN